MPKSQQVAKIRQILSNRGAGADTLDLVDDLVDPTVGYEDNKREILRRVGFDAYTQRSAQAMVHEQCPSAIADCATNGIDACEFACEECRDTPSCRKLTQKVEPLKKKVVKITKPPKVTKTERVNLIGAPIYKIEGHKGDWVKRMIEVPVNRRDEYLKELLGKEGKGNALMIKDDFFIRRRISTEGERLKKVVKPTKPIKTPKAAKKSKVTTKPKMPKPIPVAKSKSKFHEKVLTDAQIQHARKKGYVHITIEGVKKRVSKKNFAARKRTIYWYKSGGKVSLKVVRR